MKIAFCGDGSLEFVRDDLVDLCHDPVGVPLRIALHDFDAERQAHAVAVARAIVAQSGALVRVEPARERAEALDGADFVVCELEPGGIDAFRTTAAVAARHGVRVGRGDTIGIGGIVRGLRTVPEMLDIAHSMRARCPDARLLSYTNPMAMSAWAVGPVLRQSRFVGLCHAVQETEHLLAGLAGITDPTGLVLRAAGVNHLSFVLSAHHDGACLEERLADALAADPVDVPPLVAELYRRFGHLPAGVTAEYFPWFMRDGAELERLGVRLDEVEAENEAVLVEMAEDTRRMRAGEPLDADPAGGLAARVVRALATGGEDRLHATVLNDGLITNLPVEAGVEVPCRLSGGEILPEPIGALPPQLAALVHSFLAVVELTVRAVVEQDVRHVHHAVLVDPATAGALSVARIEALCDELLGTPGLVPTWARAGSPTAKR